jgi:hypothetical protein
VRGRTRQNRDGAPTTGPQVGLLQAIRRRLLAAREAWQLSAERRARRRFPSQHCRQVIPAGTQTGQLVRFELAHGSDHPLARAPSRAHGFTQVPLTYLTPRADLVLSRRNMAGINADPPPLPQRGVRHHITLKFA